MRHRVVCLDADADFRLLVDMALDGSDDFALVGDSAFGDATLALVRDANPDVVLVDAIGGGDGIAFVPALRAAVPDALIMAMVGFDADELRGSLTSAGAVGQISKRIRPTQLAAEIRTLAAMLEMVERAVDVTNTELTPELTSGRQARRFVDAALTQWHCEELADTITLLVSELVANAVMHAHSASQVSVLLHPGCVRIEVTDYDPTMPKRRLAEPDMPTGRGLALVEKLSRSWGIDPTPAGKCIWFEVDRPDSDDKGREGA